MTLDRSTGDASGSVTSPDTLTGRQIGDFLLDEPLKQGGFGVIYRAWQSTLARTVAVKVMRSDQDSQIERFLQEAQVASRLDHPYAAHIYAFGVESDGLLWIAMELVRGTSLRDFLATQGSVSPARFVPILEKICEVVYTAHEQGLIHRDIKPSNVMVVSRAGTLLPKLLDLGIARVVESLDDDDDDDDAGEWLGLDDPSIEIPPDLLLANVLDTSSHTRSQRAGFVGSPAYMSPEQWSESSQSDARSDQYSLAVMTYEAITGRLPFSADTLDTMSDAHRTAVMPPLGDGYPAALETVLARGLAKNPDARYPDVLSFAQAFRAAAGLQPTTEHEVHARLGAPLREAMLARAPQPLADSIALFESARDPAAAVAAALTVSQAVANLLGLLAVAAFNRDDAQSQSYPGHVRAALRRPHDESLTSNQWLDVAEALTRPFSGKPDAHPVPELVLLFNDPQELTRGQQRPKSNALEPETLTDELALLQRLADSESEARSALLELLPSLSRLLERVLFLCEYRLVACHRGRTESWMGARRSARGQVTILGQRTPLRDGDVVVIGANQELLLPLSPLCRLRAPAPGVAEELFLFAGASRFGAKLVAFPIGFEWHDVDFWTWYGDHLIAIDADDTDEGEHSTGRQKSPYMGLATFSPDDSDNYFGREHEVDACVNRLRVDPLLTVIGPSGAGKSSLVQAGIIPSLPETWRAFTVRPGTNPMARLAAYLTREGFTDIAALDTETELADQLASEPRSLGRILRMKAAMSNQTLLLIVDQFEELLTLSSDQQEQQRYAAALMGAARNARDSVRVILTLRDDFLMRAQQLPALRDRLGPSLQLLATPPPSELHRILQEPAKRAGFEFDDEDLPQEMVDAIATEPGALALLSFTASKLWELRDRPARLLRRSAYEQLGGVGGALSRHAEDSLEAMTELDQRLVREVFRQLITADGTRAVLTRRELSQLLGQAEHAPLVLERLINARLLVAQEGDDGEDRVEVVHEALLSSWSRLVSWQREDAESSRLRDQVRETARQWVARSRPQGLLWRDDALLEYRLWRPRYAGTLTDDEEEFARASLTAAARVQRRQRVLLVSAFASLTIGLLVVLLLARTAYIERGRAERQQNRAENLAEESTRHAAQARGNLHNLYIEQGRLALLSGQTRPAFAYLNAARIAGVDTPAVRFSLARASESLADEPILLRGHRGTVWSTRFSPDGARLASAGADSDIRLWNAADGTLQARLTGHEKDVWSVAFSPDGAALVSASWDHSIRVWQTTGGQMVWTGEHTDRVLWAAFSPDGRLVGSASRDTTVKLWDAQRGQLRTTLAHPEPVLVADFSPDGARVTTGDARGVVRVWNVATGALESTATALTAPLVAIQFNATGERIATATSNGQIGVIDAAMGATNHWTGHVGRVSQVTFSPTGEHLITVSEDQTARLWNPTTGELLHRLGSHTGGVTDAHFNRDGTHVVTVSRDATARMWDVATGVCLWTFSGHEDGLWTGALSPTDQQLATGSFNGEVRLWSATRSLPRESLPAQKTEMRAALLSPDDTRVATARTSSDRQRAIAQIWARSGQLLQRLEAPFTQGLSGKLHLAWHTDGRQLLLSGGDQAVIWDLEQGRELRRIGDHGRKTRHARFSADGAAIITGGDDGTIKIWNADTGALVQTLTGHRAPVMFLDLTRDGQRLASTSLDQTSRVWDASTGTLLHTLTHDRQQNMNVIRFSAGGRRLLTTSEQKPVLIWEVATGTLATTLAGHSDAIPDAAFSPDGQLVVTGSEDGTLKVWNATSGTVLWSSAPRMHKLHSVAFSADGNDLIAAQGTAAGIWSMTYEQRTGEQLRAFARCRIGYQIVDGRLVRQDLEPCPVNR